MKISTISLFSSLFLAQTYFASDVSGRTIERSAFAEKMHEGGLAPCKTPLHPLQTGEWRKNQQNDMWTRVISRVATKHVQAMEIPGRLKTSLFNRNLPKVAIMNNSGKPVEWGVQYIALSRFAEAIENSLGTLLKESEVHSIVLCVNDINDPKFNPLTAFIQHDKGMLSYQRI